jgi:hypothetical protein
VVEGGYMVSENLQYKLTISDEYIDKQEDDNGMATESQRAKIGRQLLEGGMFACRSIYRRRISEMALPRRETKKEEEKYVDVMYRQEKKRTFHSFDRQHI